MNNSISLNDLHRAGLQVSADSAQPLISFTRPADGFDAPAVLGEMEPLKTVPMYEASARAMQEKMDQSETFDYGYDDVAACLWRVLARIDGSTTRSIGRPPSERVIDVGYDRNGEMRKLTVPDGWMSLPVGLGQAFVEKASHTGTTVHFKFGRNNQTKINGILVHLREELAERSIYRGQIITHDYQFVNVTDVDLDQLVFNEHVKRAVDASIGNHIMKREELDANGESHKHSVLLAGEPGTGKTLVVRMAQKLLFQRGFGGVIAPAGATPSQLRQAMTVARQLRRNDAITGVFVEDIEKLAVTDRSGVLDILDGAQSKDDRILLVMTTNFADDIADEAMLRQGRIDTYIVTDLPERPTFERLIRKRLGGMIADDVDFDRLFKSFEGMTPAWIDGAIAKLKLTHLARTGSLDIEQVTTEDLLGAYALLKPQWELAQRAKAEAAKPKIPTFDKAMRQLVTEVILDNQQVVDVDYMYMAERVVQEMPRVLDEDDVHNVVESLIDRTRVSLNDGDLAGVLRVY